MPPANLKDPLKKPSVVHELLVLDELLPGAVVRRHHEPAHDGADLLELFGDALRLASKREDVDFVRVLAHVQRSLEQPEQLALLHVEPERDVLGALDEVHRGVEVGSRGVQSAGGVVAHRDVVLVLVGIRRRRERAVGRRLHRRRIHVRCVRQLGLLRRILGRVRGHRARLSLGCVHGFLDLADFLRQRLGADAFARVE